MSHHHPSESHREVFDKAQREEADAVKAMNGETKKASTRRLDRYPYADLPSEKIYYEAALKKYELLDEAEEQAHALETEHQKLIELVRDAEKTLRDFESKELDMHNRNSAT